MTDHDLHVVHGEIAGIETTIRCMLEVLPAEQRRQLAAVLERQAERIEASFLASPVQDIAREHATAFLRDMRDACLAQPEEPS